jgi:hypothetical protein
LRGRRFRREGRNHGSQDQGPKDSEPFLFHLFYLPGAATAAAFVSGAAFTVKSADFEMV